MDAGPMRHFPLPITLGRESPRQRTSMQPSIQLCHAPCPALHLPLQCPPLHCTAIWKGVVAPARAWLLHNSGRTRATAAVGAGTPSWPSGPYGRRCALEAVCGQLFERPLLSEALHQRTADVVAPLQPHVLRWTCGLGAWALDAPDAAFIANLSAVWIPSAVCMPLPRRGDAHACTGCCLAPGG